MLVLADRGFYGFSCGTGRGTGADLLWRVRIHDERLGQRDASLPDGSWLAHRPEFGRQPRR